jgi:acetylglutamate kinase
MQENRMRRVLVKVGGETLKDPRDRARLAHDLAGVRDQGVQLCVVHGAGPQITALGQRLGVRSTFRGGRRVTDAAMLEAVAMAMAGQVGPLLLAACLEAGLPAVSTPAASGGCVLGRKRPPRSVPGEAELVDFGLVADVAQVDGRMLEALWGAGLVPLLSSLVVDAHGQLLNLNADTLVTALTERVWFDDVVLLTGVPGVYRDLEDKSSHLPELLDTDVRSLIDSGAVQGGMVVKLEEVAAILQRGANAVWIVGFQEPGAVTAALSGQPGLRTVVRAAVK